jgi:hypothetical protein
MAAQTSIEKMKLSSSTDGRPIKIAATATPGTTVHTAGSGIDIVYLQLCNTDTTARKVTIEWGGTTSPDDTIELTIPPEGGIIEMPPMLIQNSLVVKVFCATANVVICGGYVERLA